MGIEDSDKGKNSWAGGDDREKQLGPTEVEKIRAEVASRARTKERTAPIVGQEVRSISVNPEKISASEAIASIREQHKDVFRSGQDYFQKLVQLKGGTFKQTFHLNSRGAISSETLMSYPASTIEEAGRESNQNKIIGLIACAMGTGQVDEKITAVPDYTTDDLRYAAMWLTERCPEIQISFEEDRAKSTFSYTATLTEKPE